MGDAEAALTFFARAEEIAPRDARVKARMAPALVQLEQAATALPLFAEAIALGAPEAEIAGDRGLAYDMLGDPRARAARLCAGAAPRATIPRSRRRLALSLAISGQRERGAADARRPAARQRPRRLAHPGLHPGADRRCRRRRPDAPQRIDAGGARARRWRPSCPARRA